MSLSTENEATPENSDDDCTGLPLLPTWDRVYWFVIVVFVVYVVLLRVLSKGFA